MIEKKVDVAIIGGGPAGLAAAIKLYELGIKNILLIERDRFLGGVLQQCIHTGFGLKIFGEELTGPEYAYRFIEKLHNLNIPYETKTSVINIKSNEHNPKEKILIAINQKSGFIKIICKALILAMGCRERSRGAINIPGKRPAGILTAGLAQKYVNIHGYLPGKNVVILGSGDIGLIMARRLTLEGAKVSGVIEILPYCSGLIRNKVQCLDDFGIPLYLRHTVSFIEGNNRVESVTISKIDDNLNPIKGSNFKLECDTLLLSVGLIPENELSTMAGVVLDEATGGPIVNQYMETNINGIFCCGNVAQVHDIVDFVTLEAQKAAEGVYKYLYYNQIKNKTSIKTTVGKGVRYILPHLITTYDGKIDEDIILSMRVSEPLNKVKLNIKGIKSIKKAYVRPSEMIQLKISKDEINDYVKTTKGDIITVDVEV